MVDIPDFCIHPLGWPRILSDFWATLLQNGLLGHPTIVGCHCCCRTYRFQEIKWSWKSWNFEIDPGKITEKKSWSQISFCKKNFELPILASSCMNTVLLVSATNSRKNLLCVKKRLRKQDQNKKESSWKFDCALESSWKSAPFYRNPDDTHMLIAEVQQGLGADKVPMKKIVCEISWNFVINSSCWTVIVKLQFQAN